MMTRRKRNRSAHRAGRRADFTPGQVSDALARTLHGPTPADMAPIPPPEASADAPIVLSAVCDDTLVRAGLRDCGIVLPAPEPGRDMVLVTESETSGILHVLILSSRPGLAGAWFLKILATGDLDRDSTLIVERWHAGTLLPKGAPRP